MNPEETPAPPINEPRPAATPKRIPLPWIRSRPKDLPFRAGDPT